MKLYKVIFMFLFFFYACNESANKDAKPKKSIGRKKLLTITKKPIKDTLFKNFSGNNIVIPNQYSIRETFVTPYHTSQISVLDLKCKEPYLCLYNGIIRWNGEKVILIFIGKANQKYWVMDGSTSSNSQVSYCQIKSYDSTGKLIDFFPIPDEDIVISNATTDDKLKIKKNIKRVCDSIPFKAMTQKGISFKFTKKPSGDCSATELEVIDTIANIRIEWRVDVDYLSCLYEHCEQILTVSKANR